MKKIFAIVSIIFAVFLGFNLWQPVEISDFTGGVNISVAKDNLKGNEFLQLTNFVFRNGKLQTREGYSYFLSDNAFSEDPVEFISNYQSEKDWKLLVSDGKSLWCLEDSMDLFDRYNPFTYNEFSCKTTQGDSVIYGTNDSLKWLSLLDWGDSLKFIIGEDTFRVSHIVLDTVLILTDTVSFSVSDTSYEILTDFGTVYDVINLGSVAYVACERGLIKYNGYEFEAIDSADQPMRFKIDSIRPLGQVGAVFYIDTTDYGCGSCSDWFPGEYSGYYAMFSTNPYFEDSSYSTEYTTPDKLAGKYFKTIFRVGVGAACQLIVDINPYAFGVFPDTQFIFISKRDYKFVMRLVPISDTAYAIMELNEATVGDSIAQIGTGLNDISAYGDLYGTHNGKWNFRLPPTYFEIVMKNSGDNDQFMWRIPSEPTFLSGYVDIDAEPDTIELIKVKTSYPSGVPKYDTLRGCFIVFQDSTGHTIDDTFRIYIDHNYGTYWAMDTSDPLADYLDSAYFERGDYTIRIDSGSSYKILTQYDQKYFFIGGIAPDTIGRWQAHPLIDATHEYKVNLGDTGFYHTNRAFDFYRMERLISPAASGYQYMEYAWARLFWKPIELSQSVRCSEPFMPESTLAGNEFTIETSDGDKITGIKKMGDRLLVYKNYSVSELYPTTLAYTEESQEGPFAVRFLSDQTGCIAPKTLVGSNEHYFLSSKGFVVYQGGASAQILSNAISKWLTDSLNLERIGEATAIITADGKDIWLSLPSISATAGNQATFVLNLETGAWTRFDFAFNAAINKKINGTEKTLFAASGSGKIYSYGGDLDNGDSIDAIIQTGYVNFGLPERYVHSRNVIYDYEKPASATVRLITGFYDDFNGSIVWADTATNTESFGQNDVFCDPSVYGRNLSLRIKITNAHDVKIPIIKWFLQAGGYIK